MSSAHRVAGLAAAVSVGLAASVHGTDLGDWLVYGRILLWDDARRLGPIAFVAGLALSAVAASIGRSLWLARRMWTLVAAGTALAMVPLVAVQAARGTIRGLTLISASPSPTAFAAGLGVVFGYGLAVGSTITLVGEPRQGPQTYRVGIVAALVAGDAVRVPLNTQWQTGLAIVATAASTAAAITATNGRASAAIAGPSPRESAAPQRLPLWPLLVAIATSVALLIGETLVSARFELAVNDLYGSGGDLPRARVGFVLYALVACVLVGGLATYVWHRGRGGGLRVIAVGFLLGMVTAIRPDMFGWLPTDRVAVGSAVVIVVGAAYVGVTSRDPRWSGRPWDVAGVIVAVGGAVYLIIEGLHVNRTAPSGQIADVVMMLGTVLALVAYGRRAVGTSTGTATDGPATDGPAITGPATNGAAINGPATAGPPTIGRTALSGAEVTIAAVAALIGARLFAGAAEILALRDAADRGAPAALPTAYVHSLQALVLVPLGLAVLVVIVVSGRDGSTVDRKDRAPRTPGPNVTSVSDSAA